MIDEIKNNYELEIAIEYLIKQCKYDSDEDYMRDLLDSRDSLLNRSSKLNNFIKETLRLSSDKIKELKLLIKSERIKKDELSWIEHDNERLCNFLFHILTNIKILKSLHNDNDINLNNMIYKSDKNIDERIFREHLESNAIYNKEKYKEVCNHLEHINYNKKTKQLLITELKKSWANIATDISIISFLDKDNLIQNKWALDYLLKNKDDNFEFKINYNKDYYYNIVLYFDVCENIYKKKHLLDKMKKAWAQKKHRDSKNGFKDYSFNMKEDINYKLSEMSRELNMSKNLLVEKIIEREYKNFKLNTK
ncbi:hypothetical protein [Photobacterium leiognathi]|uniref:hypothetical protein n=1 Tax=Photobacterium leiognathi TaxID=553611 RepID=UPI002982A068|nr:hypothetical protein [Photobacterium leiognathi]